LREYIVLRAREYTALSGSTLVKRWLGSTP
jgi:hypothetical protein